VNEFIEFYSILITIVPIEVIIIILGGLVFYIIEILKGDNSAKGQKNTK